MRIPEGPPSGSDTEVLGRGGVLWAGRMVGVRCAIGWPGTAVPTVVATFSGPASVVTMLGRVCRPGGWSGSTGQHAGRGPRGPTVVATSAAPGCRGVLWARRMVGVRCAMGWPGTAVPTVVATFSGPTSKSSILARAPRMR